MTDKYKYGSISLRQNTLEKLRDLSSNIVKGGKLSSAKTVEILIEEKVSNSLDKSERISNGKTHLKEA
jgi:hypothetical protein